MKRTFIACLIILVIACALVIAIEYDPGYLLLSYHQYTLETSIWVGLAAFLFLLWLVGFFFSVLRRTISGSSMMGKWFSSRGARRSQQQTTKGMIAFIEGNWNDAQRILSRAATKSETPLLNYLLAARASHALDDDKAIKEYLNKAEESTSGASIAVGLTQAELQIRQGKFEQSLATLTRVRRNSGKHPYVLELLKQVYVGLKDWEQLMSLLPELKKHHVVSQKELEQLELLAAHQRIIDAGNTRQDSLNKLESLWSKLPKSTTKKADVIVCYAEQIMRHGGDKQAEKIIRNQLKKEWDSRLVDLYGKVQGEDNSKQLLHAENWLKERNNDAALFLCLGRLSLRNSLWDKAKEYFNNSLKVSESPEVCAELGRLLAHLGEHEKSNEYFQRSLQFESSGLMALPMPEKNNV
jgi:HemY protein